MSQEGRGGKMREQGKGGGGGGGLNMMRLEASKANRGVEKDCGVL